MIKKILVISLVLVTTTLTQPRVVENHALKEVRCLAEAIWQEARGEPVLGQLAVAKVVVNRARDQRWPGSICKVVFQPHQFTWTAWWTGWKADPHSWKLAHLVLHNPGVLTHFRATHFHAHYVKPGWSKKLKKIQKIGNHVFYA